MADCLPDGLAAELREGRAVVLDEGPLLDRALEEVAQWLEDATPQ